MKNIPFWVQKTRNHGKIIITRKAPGHNEKAPC